MSLFFSANIHRMTMNDDVSSMKLQVCICSMSAMHDDDVDASKLTSRIEFSFVVSRIMICNFHGINHIWDEIIKINTCNILQ